MKATQPTSRTPTMSSVVATGRRMNIREGLMNLIYPTSELVAGTGSCRTRRRVPLNSGRGHGRSRARGGVARRNQTSALQFVLPVGHHRLAGIHAFGDHRGIAL